MPAKKILTGGEAAVAHRAKPKVIQAHKYEWSKQDIDQQWEQIRIRGEQISADIAALRARINSN